MKKSIVLKFGGSFMCRSGYSTALNRVKTHVENGYKVVVVASALGNTTNALMSIVNSVKTRTIDTFNNIVDNIKSIHYPLLKELNFDKSLLANKLEKLNNLIDLFRSPLTIGLELTQIQIKILSMGEIISAVIMHKYLMTHYYNEKCELINSRNFIKSKKTSNFIDSNNLHISGEFYCDKDIFENICNESEINNFGCVNVFVAQGYIATTDDNKYCVLLRSGSDISASLIASAIDSQQLEIWTDVNGIYTADPRVVSNAKVIEEIDYKICCEASYSGSYVLHPYCIEYCMNKNIPIYIKNIFDPNGICTIVKNMSDEKNKIHIISQHRNITLFNIKSNMWQSAGDAGDIFRVFSENNIDVDIITTSHTSISTTTDESNQSKLDNVYSELEKKYNVEIIKNCTIVSIIVDNAQTNKLINNSTDIVNDICENGFYIRHYSSNNMNLSFVVGEKYSDNIVCEFHKRYCLTNYDKYLKPIIINLSTVFVQ